MEREYDLSQFLNLPADRPYKGTETRLHGFSYVEFSVPNCVGGIYVPRNAVKFWVPPEPESGSVALGADGKAWQREGKIWRNGTTCCSWETLNRTEGPLNIIHYA